MSTAKYPVGTLVFYKRAGIRGTVVPNVKFEGDVCIVWETGLFSSYDEEFLGEHCEIVS